MNLTSPPTFAPALRLRDQPGHREQRAEGELEALWRQHRHGLTRVAALLLDDSSVAEDVVQEAYIKCAASWKRISDPDASLAYLRSTVVNTARSVVRRRLVAIRHRPLPMPDAAPADEGAYAALERDRVVAALKELPRRQREAVTLRWYADLSEAQAAEAMGVSVGAVKAYTSRGMAALAVTLEDLR